MPTETYSIDNADVTPEFPDYPAFSATTKPTSTQVDARVEVVAGEVNGYLVAQGFTTAEVLADATAQEWVSRTIVLGVAAWCARSMRGPAATRAEVLQQEYRDRLRALVSEPAILGTLYAPAADAQGVRTHSATAPEAGRVKLFHYARSRANIF